MTENKTDRAGLIARTEALAAAATAADQWGAKQWSVLGPGGDTSGLSQPQWHVVANGVGTWPIAWAHERADADFIAASRTLVPELVAALREAADLLASQAKAEPEREALERRLLASTALLRKVDAGDVHESDPTWSFVLLPDSVLVEISEFLSLKSLLRTFASPPAGSESDERTNLREARDLLAFTSDYLRDEDMPASWWARVDDFLASTAGRSPDE